MGIKEHVKGKVSFQFYRKGELWYKADSGFMFPVPIEDTGDGQFNAEDKGILFMRYIRKHMEAIALDEAGLTPIVLSEKDAEWFVQEVFVCPLKASNERLKAAVVAYNDNYSGDE